MRTVIVLALVSTTLLAALPSVVARARWLFRAPRSAVMLWQAIGLAGCLSAVGAGLALAVVGQESGPLLGVTHLFHGFIHGRPLSGLDLYGELGLTIATDIALVLAVGFVVNCVRTLRQRVRHRRILDLVGTTREDVPEALVLDHPSAVAYCIPGLRSRIVLSSGTLSALDQRELDAVLAHEKGHLHAHHDLVLLAMSSMAGILKWVPYARIAPRSVGTLLEMAADDTASRSHGREAVASAIVHLVHAGPGASPECAFTATEAAVLRVERLLSTPGSRGLAATATGLAVVVLSLPPIAVLLSNGHP